ncbi:MAG: DUF6106 family protein [Lachnospiraceae bacterium]|nr:DUF6106 family protein [Lachnospiraceae bacterium]
MNESYIECMVQRHTPAWQAFLKYLVVFLAAVTILGGLVLSDFIILLVGVLIGVGAYFVIMNTDIEYEYLYLDKEISVDKIMHQAKRKRVAVYSVEKMEILAPIKSYHLDGYKNREAKVHDYSSGVENQPDKRYVFFYDGKEKIIIEPTEDFVKLVKNVAPRKVFTD